MCSRALAIPVQNTSSAALKNIASWHVIQLHFPTGTSLSSLALFCLIWRKRKTKEPTTCGSFMLHLSRNISTNPQRRAPFQWKALSFCFLHVVSQHTHKALCSSNVFQRFMNSEFLWFHGSQETWNLLLSLPLNQGLRWVISFLFSSFYFFLRLKSFWGIISQTHSAAEWSHHSPLLYSKNLHSCEQTMALTLVKRMWGFFLFLGLLRNSARTKQEGVLGGTTATRAEGKRQKACPAPWLTGACGKTAHIHGL